MSKRLFTGLFLLVFGSLQAQFKLNPGFSVGPSFCLMEEGTGLTEGFFTSTRAGINAGLSLSLEAGEHFWAKTGAQFNRLNFSFKQNTATDYRVDFKYGLNNLDIPLQVGFSGYLGSLRHREYLGVAFVSRLGRSFKPTFTGDSILSHTYSFTDSPAKASYLTYVAGFEIGSEFDNDASIYFGLSLRYNPDTRYSSTFNSSRFLPQTASTRGNYLMLEITYYLPRFSYWFKRDFTY
jgi:hypothetical protein